MREALDKNWVKSIYNKTSAYYDWMHRFGTFSLDQRGRKYLVNRIVKDGQTILDAGGGTGTTAILALEKGGPNIKVVVLDFSEEMLKEAERKAKVHNIGGRLTVKVGDMYDIPFPDNYFDAVISTYSTCPLENPAIAVKEMLRVLKPNGHLGIAHSCEPDNKISRKISNCIDSFIWRFPRLSLGCRSIDLSNDIKAMNVNVIENKVIGFVPWFFRLIILEKKERVPGWIVV